MPLIYYNYSLKSPLSQKRQKASSTAAPPLYHDVSARYVCTLMTTESRQVHPLIRLGPHHQHAGRVPTVRVSTNHSDGHITVIVADHTRVLGMIGIGSHLSIDVGVELSYGHDLITVSIREALEALD